MPPELNAKNCYRILGLSSEASADDIKRAYRKLALKYHPDRNQGNTGTEETFKVIKGAYEFLITQEEEPQYANTTLKNLLNTIDTSSDFPIFSQNFRKLLNIYSDDYSPTPELTQVILRDLSLTIKILKLVNAIYFKRYGNQIHTISGAVMVLGFNRIRDIALGQKFFEKLPKSIMTSYFQRLVILSFCTAFYSHEISRNTLLQGKGEEVFINSLLFNLGELLAVYYFPEKFQKIIQLATTKGISTAKAASLVLNVSFEELGLSILRHWNFPNRLIEQMTALYQQDRFQDKALTSMRQTINTAQQLSQQLLNSSLSDTDWDKKGEQLCQKLGLKRDRIDQSLSASLARFKEFIKVLQLDLPTLGLHCPYISKETGVPLKMAPSVLEESAEVKKLRVCHQLFAEVNQAIIDGKPINEIMMMVLEGIYRGIDFDRVIFCLVNPPRTLIQARFGLGKDVEELIPLLSSSLDATGNALVQAILGKQDYLVDTRDRDLDRGLMNDSFWLNSRPAVFFVCPIIVNQVVIGLLYIDRIHATAGIDDEDIRNIKIFRDLIIIAILTSRSVPNYKQTASSPAT